MIYFTDNHGLSPTIHLLLCHSIRECKSLRIVLQCHCEMVLHYWYVISTTMYSLVLGIFSFPVQCTWADLPEINLTD